MVFFYLNHTQKYYRIMYIHELAWYYVPWEKNYINKIDRKKISIFLNQKYLEITT